jgi:hypothetical protein
MAREKAVEIRKRSLQLPFEARLIDRSNRVRAPQLLQLSNQIFLGGVLRDQRVMSVRGRVESACIAKLRAAAPLSQLAQLDRNVRLDIGGKQFNFRLRVVVPADAFLKHTQRFMG